MTTQKTVRGQGLRYVSGWTWVAQLYLQSSKQEVSLPLLEQMSLGEMLRQKQLKQPRSKSV